ncbi:MAG: hypothetical protein HW403_1068, partial [Dehalococcoidia bacterium]|nr:hypothetical protein [Dehalococcoidia bacterium]
MSIRAGEKTRDTPNGARKNDRLSESAPHHVRKAIVRRALIPSAVLALAFLITLVGLYVSHLSAVLQVIILGVSLSLLLTAHAYLVKGTASAVASLYQRSLQELEQELHDLTFRVDTSTLIDQVTGGYTSEYLHARLREEVARSQRHGRAITLILVDLSRFHLINQRYGRMMGNQILRRFALNTLRSVVRNSDVVARYGGDEFAILLPETDQERGLVVAERIEKAAARGTILPEGERIDLPIALGMAVFPQQGRTAEDLL